MDFGKEWLLAFLNFGPLTFSVLLIFTAIFEALLATDNPRWKWLSGHGRFDGQERFLATQGDWVPLIKLRLTYITAMTLAGVTADTLLILWDRMK